MAVLELRERGTNQRGLPGSGWAIHPGVNWLPAAYRRSETVVELLKLGVSTEHLRRQVLVGEQPRSRDDGFVAEHAPSCAGPRIKKMRGRRPACPVGRESCDVLAPVLRSDAAIEVSATNVRENRSRSKAAADSILLCVSRIDILSGVGAPETDMKKKRRKQKPRSRAVRRSRKKHEASRAPFVGSFTEERVNTIVAEQMGAARDRLSLETELINDLGGDSLDLVELVMEIEDEFDINIPDEDAEKIRTIGDAVGYVSERISDEPQPKATRFVEIALDDANVLRVRVREVDGTIIDASGSKTLPSGLRVPATEIRLSATLALFETMINDRAVTENDIQEFLQANTFILKGVDYNVAIPQAVITTYREKKVVKDRADFVLAPIDQQSFCKVLEIKAPWVKPSLRPPQRHRAFSAALLDGIHQLQDYAGAFTDSRTRDRFYDRYKIDVPYQPRMHLLIGRRWDFHSVARLQEIQMRNHVDIESYDQLIDRVRRQLGVNAPNQSTTRRLSRRPQRETDTS